MTAILIHGELFTDRPPTVHEVHELISEAVVSGADPHRSYFTLTAHRDGEERLRFLTRIVEESK